jgi:E3 ubiquitin-protein ligase RNF216
MCQCSEGHLFCLDCLRRYGEEQLFGAQKTKLECMTTSDSGGKCLGTFSQEMIKRALPKKVLEKLEEATFMAAVESAGIENLTRCPRCDFQAVVEDRVMVCPAIGCGYESCRECGEPPHFPLKCDEVEKQCHAESRKRIEEAMTEARVRICPNVNCGKR